MKKMTYLIYFIGASRDYGMWGGRESNFLALLYTNAFFAAIYFIAKEREYGFLTNNIVIPYMKIKLLIPQAASGSLCEVLVNNIMRF